MDKPWTTLRVAHRLPTGRRLPTSSTALDPILIKSGKVKTNTPAPALAYSTPVTVQTTGTTADFERGRLPGTLDRQRGKLFGLTIQPERLHSIREERRPGSTYASLANCRHEVAEAEKMMRREGIRWLDSSTKSIEEISATVLQELHLR